MVIKCTPHKVFLNFWYACIAGKGAYTPPPLPPLLLSKILQFLEIQDIATFYRPIGKQKYWITLLTNLYIISTLKVS